jgi:hypothetical protein
MEVEILAKKKKEAYCEHGKRKRNCCFCGGSGLCEHNRQKYHCKECKGASICEHGKIKNGCRECGGSAFCEHNKLKHRCQECGGISICEHNKRKSQCRDCGGSDFCQHDKRKSRCQECGGGSICEHGKDIAYCRDCGGSAYCEHNKQKKHCKQCGGSALCKSEWCETIASKKYNGYCLRCCIYLCPDIPVVRNYKTKEKEVVDRIKEAFPMYDWAEDKKVPDGCSKRRPDLLLDMGSHVIIVEIDENKHDTYDCSCENKRLMELSQDLQHRPIVFIRFNPDGYTDDEGNEIKSCWKTNKSGITQIAKEKIQEWNDRINALKEQIRYWTTHKSDKTIEIIELFY